MNDFAVIHVHKEFMFDSDNIKTGFFSKKSKQMRLLLE